MKAQPKKTSMSLHDLHDSPKVRPTTVWRGATTAHFGELREPLIQFIDDSDIIVGCVAWATSGGVLDALAGCQTALVVQKESWWKKRDPRGAALARRYANLSNGLDASFFPPPLGGRIVRNKLVLNEGRVAPITCVGDGSGGHFKPLMHHKFIVRCEMVDGVLVAKSVWTGSFNFSGNANNSFENAVEIHDEVIAEAYLREFSLVASLAEPMNWRLSRPNPKGAHKVAAFEPLPPTPKPLTKKTVKKTAARKKTAKKATPARKKTTPRKKA